MAAVNLGCPQCLPRNKFGSLHGSPRRTHYCRAQKTSQLAPLRFGKIHGICILNSFLSNGLRANSLGGMRRFPEVGKRHSQVARPWSAAVGRVFHGRGVSLHRVRIGQRSSRVRRRQRFAILARETRPEGIARAPEPARWFAQAVRHMGEASRLPLQRGPEPMRAWAQRGGGASPSSESGRQDDPDRPRHRYPHSETDVAETDQRPTQIDSHANFFQEIGSCTNKFGTHFYQIRVLIAGSRRFGLRQMAASISESCL
jgi:hypothetical protein